MSLDRITLTGLEVFAHHGVFEHEQASGQVFRIDVTVALDLTGARLHDDLAQTLHYGELATAIHERVAGERWDLIERVAERVIDLVFEDERVQEAEVTVHKPDAPIEVAFEDVSVTVVRRRS